MAPRSKVEQMPPGDRDWLEKELVKRGFADYQELSELLKNRGYEISHAAVHRHGKKLERRLAAIKASTEAARQIAESVPDEKDQRSAAVISLVQTALFDALLDVMESQDADPEDQIKLLSSAAYAVGQVSKASVTQKKFESEVMAKLDALDKEAQKGQKRLDKETLAAVREALYGR